MGSVRQVFTLVLLGMLAACTSGPSDGDIKTAVSKLVTESDGINRLKDENVCGVAKGAVTEVTTVVVVERGEKHEKEGYWPLRVTVTGKCMAERPNCGETKNELCAPEPAEVKDVELEVRLKKDDFGKWQAEAVPPKRSARDEAASHAGSAPPLPKLAIDPSEVTEIVIEVGEQAPVTLKKDGTTWRLGGGEAAHTKNVDAVLDNLGKLKVVALIDANPSAALHAKYELDAARGVHITVRGGGKTLADFTVGKTGARGTMALVEEKVVAINGFSRFYYERKAEAWRAP